MKIILKTWAMTFSKNFIGSLSWISSGTENAESSLDYSIDKIFRLLVFSILLFPTSKKKTFEQRNLFFETFEGFDLDSVYYALDISPEIRAVFRNGVLSTQATYTEESFRLS